MKLNGKKGILLDIGCGGNKQKGNFIGMDRRKLPGVDIVHDLEKVPYPLKDNSCLTIVGSHIIEHLNPKLTIDIFNELWRITKPGGQLLLATPYAGSSYYWQDPTHCNGFTERTFWYFDPEHSSKLWGIYQPKPWKIEHCTYQVNGNLEVVLRKRTER